MNTRRPSKIRVISSLLRSTNRIPPRSSDQELMAFFQDWMRVQGYVRTTRVFYGSIVQRLSRFFPRKSFAAMTPFDIAEFLEETSRPPLSAGYAGDQLCGLRCFYDYLCLGGVVDKVSPRFLHIRSPIKKLPRILSRSQVRRLLRNASCLRDRAILEMMYSTGCRARELIKMRIADVDFRAQTVRVLGKRRGRIVYFGRSAKQTLLRYLDGRTTGFVFEDVHPSQKTHLTHRGLSWYGNWSEQAPDGRAVRRCMAVGPWKNGSRQAELRGQKRLAEALKNIDLTRRRHGLSYETIHLILRAAGNRAGIHRLTARILRHTFATHLIDRGADLLTVQRLLGHTTVSSTEVYLRLSNATVAKNYFRFHPRAE